MFVKVVKVAKVAKFAKVANYSMLEKIRSDICEVRVALT